MAHHFASGVFYGQSAWHGLGTTLSEDDNRRFSTDDTLCLAGACFDVNKIPQFIELNGEKVLTGAYATVRTDTGAVLGTVGEKYTPLQNTEQFKWFQPFLDTKEVAFETAGVLKDGAIVWALARILSGDGVVDVGGGDTIAKYLMTYTSHDGSLATGVMFAPIRTVCWNTLSMNLSSDVAKQLKVRHTKRQMTTLNEIRETISLMDREFQMTASQFQKLKRAIINKDDMVKYCKIVFECDKEEKLSTRMGNIIERCVSLAMDGMGNNGETAWDAYNGITQWLTYERGSNNNRQHQNAFGPGAAINQRALKVAMQLAN
jgi:phage/plasmid-like protein (TIGR03299 family)